MGNLYFRLSHVQAFTLPTSRISNSKPAHAMTYHAKPPAPSGTRHGHDTPTQTLRRRNFRMCKCVKFVRRSQRS
ncbi:MAG: hypothetical protein IJM81_10985 [Prevotella sp.]|nr:hypothetical protein [Prevotella sp.]